MWLASTAAVGALGWPLSAVSDWPAERAAGGVLLVVPLASLAASSLTAVLALRSPA